MKFKECIKILSKNDRNGSWEEVETLEELKESLECSIDEHKDEPEIAEFYKNLLKQL